ncbi:formin Fus1 [Schizosaccharomyces japonicus yFS275]|uniref:Formin Fus1 n=1 Tax=Schizosaccharomyces japonicus (strain yFS275 / FY16936) TaxID=402676 RepID=B6JZB4_SCHJY|nr:formin Fus1 [Schizosaccharomyces japonicus yFS275]EEB06882.2 formin Fus1 [Schizosaccharomyces japonicus yFS275]
MGKSTTDLIMNGLSVHGPSQSLSPTVFSTADCHSKMHSSPSTLSVLNKHSVSSSPNSRHDLSRANGMSSTSFVDVSRAGAYAFPGRLSKKEVIHQIESWITDDDQSPIKRELSEMFTRSSSDTEILDELYNIVLENSGTRKHSMLTNEESPEKKISCIQFYLMNQEPSSSLDSSQSNLRSIDKNTPYWYIRKLSEGSMKPKNLVSLSVALRTQSVSWVREFVSLNGQDLLTRTLEIIHGKKQLKKVHFDIELGALKCLRCIMNDKCGVTKTLENQNSVNAICKSLLSQKLSITRVAAELLVFLCYWEPPNGVSNVLSGFESAGFAILDRQVPYLEIWIQNWNTAVESRGRLGSLVGAGAQAREEGLHYGHAVTDCCIIYMMLINGIIDNCIDRKGSLSFYESLMENGFHDLLKKLASMHDVSLNKQLKKFSHLKQKIFTKSVAVSKCKDPHHRAVSIVNADLAELLAKLNNSMNKEAFISFFANLFRLIQENKNPERIIQLLDCIIICISGGDRANEAPISKLYDSLRSEGLDNLHSIRASLRPPEIKSIQSYLQRVKSEVQDYRQSRAGSSSSPEVNPTDSLNQPNSFAPKNRTNELLLSRDGSDRVDSSYSIQSEAEKQLERIKTGCTLAGIHLDSSADVSSITEENYEQNNDNMLNAFRKLDSLQSLGNFGSVPTRYTKSNSTKCLESPSGLLSTSLDNEQDKVASDFFSSNENHDMKPETAKLTQEGTLSIDERPREGDSTTCFIEPVMIKDDESLLSKAKKIESTNGKSNTLATFKRETPIPFGEGVAQTSIAVAEIPISESANEPLELEPSNSTADVTLVNCEPNTHAAPPPPPPPPPLPVLHSNGFQPLDERDSRGCLAPGSTTVEAEESLIPLPDDYPVELRISTEVSKSPPPPVLPAPVADSEEKRRLKQLHWIRITSPQGTTLWNTVATAGKDIWAELREKGFLEDLQKGFYMRNVKCVSKPKATKRIYLPNELQKVFGIVFHKFSALSPIDIAKKFYECDKELLDLVPFLNESKVFHQDAVRKQLRPFQTVIKRAVDPPRNFERINELERWDQLYTLLVVDSEEYFVHRMKALEFKLDLEQTHRGLVRQMRYIRIACSDVRLSTSFKGFLGFVLCLGNHMNDSLKQATAYRLESLERMAMVKDERDGYSLLHFVERYIRKHCPDTVSFEKEFHRVPVAAKMNLEQVDLEVQSFVKRLTEVKSDLSTGALSGQSYLHPDDRIRDFILPWMPTAEDLVSKIKQGFDNMKKAFEDLLCYYGEIEENVNLRNPFFVVLHDFLKNLEKAKTENLRLEALQTERQVMESHKETTRPDILKAIMQDEKNSNEPTMDVLLEKLKTGLCNSSRSPQTKKQDLERGTETMNGNNPRIMTNESLFVTQRKRFTVVETAHGLLDSLLASESEQSFKE